MKFWRLMWLMILLSSSALTSAHSSMTVNLSAMLLPATEGNATLSQSAKPQSTFNYSPRLIHYLWVKTKKITCTHSLNGLSNNVSNSVDHVIEPFYLTYNTLLSHSLFIRSVNHMTPLIPRPYWMEHSASYSGKLNGWKESNILYAGSLTYHNANLKI